MKYAKIHGVKYSTTAAKKISREHMMHQKNFAAALNLTYIQKK